MTFKKVWANIVLWWARLASRWKPAVEVPALPEFEVAGTESGVVVPSSLIDLEFVGAEVVAEQPNELEHAMKQFVLLLTARELRAHRHYSATGSCNIDVPRQDCRVVKPIDSRVSRSRNSRASR